MSGCKSAQRYLRELLQCCGRSTDSGCECNDRWRRPDDHSRTNAPTAQPRGAANWRVTPRVRRASHQLTCLEVYHRQLHPSHRTGTLRCERPGWHASDEAMCTVSAIEYMREERPFCPVSLAMLAAQCIMPGLDSYWFGFIKSDSVEVSASSFASRFAILRSISSLKIPNDGSARCPPSGSFCL